MKAVLTHAHVMLNIQNAPVNYEQKNCGKRIVVDGFGDGAATHTKISSRQFT